MDWATSAPSEISIRGGGCGGLAPAAVDLCCFGAEEAGLLGPLDFFDFADVVVPVLAADEGGGVDGEGVVDVDAAANSAVLLGPPDAFLEVLIGEFFGEALFGSAFHGVGFADDAVFEVSHVVGAHYDARVHSFEEADVVFETAHDALFAGAVGVAGGAEDGDLHAVTFLDSESLAGIGVHENWVGVDDLGVVFPMTGAALGMDVPFKGGEDIAVVGEIDVLRDVMVDGGGAGIAIGERKADGFGGGGEDLVVDVDLAVGGGEAADGFAVFENADWFTAGSHDETIFFAGAFQFLLGKWALIECVIFLSSFILPHTAAFEFFPRNREVFVPVFVE